LPVPFEDEFAFGLGLLVEGLSGGSTPQAASRRRTAVADMWTVLCTCRYTVEQDETGWWSAHASLPGGGANGEGQTPEEAVADLREALDGWFAEFGVPDELTITVRDVA
jgi:predicted RNase H-like HicB family nuclease